jgi:hypothetical protein
LEAEPDVDEADAQTLGGGLAQASGGWGVKEVEPSDAMLALRLIAVGSICDFGMTLFAPPALGEAAIKRIAAAFATMAFTESRCRLGFRVSGRAAIERGCGTRHGDIALPSVAGIAGAQMYSRVEEYRRRGNEARQRAAQATNLSVKEAFVEVARGWFTLAEQVAWLDGERIRSEQNDKKE